MPPTVLTIVNQCSPNRIAPQFLPVITDALAVYQSIFGDELQNIRLMGSVPRGEAGRHSDIDFIAVLHVSPNTEQTATLASEEGKLHDKYAFIPKVDLESVPAEGLSEFRRFVFASDSLSVFGPDPYTQPILTIERQKLADLVTPDLTQIHASYYCAVEQADEAHEELLRFYSRLIGKDILKCFRRIALLRGGEYERNIPVIYRQLLQYAPEHRELLHELFDLYSNPTGNRQRLLRALRHVETTGTHGPSTDSL